MEKMTTTQRLFAQWKAATFDQNGMVQLDHFVYEPAVGKMFQKAAGVVTVAGSAGVNFASLLVVAPDDASRSDSFFADMKTIADACGFDVREYRLMGAATLESPTQALSPDQEKEKFAMITAFAHRVEADKKMIDALQRPDVQAVLDRYQADFNVWQFTADAR